jgi:hypothetical protein
MKNTIHFITAMFAVFLFSINNVTAQLTFHKSYGNFMASTTPNGIIKTSDGGYLIFSDYFDVPGSQSGLLVKTTVTGDTLWTKFLKNTISSLYTIITSAIEIPNGQGYMLTGYYLDAFAPLDPSGSLIFGLDVNGNMQWVKEFESNVSPALCWFKSACLSYDGNILIFGMTGLYLTPFSNVLLKVTPAGTVLWTKNISGYEQQDANTQTVLELPDHSIILMCDTAILPATIKIAIIKLDSNGSLIWSKNYGTTGDIIVPMSLTIGTSSSLLVTGMHANANNLSIGFMMSLDSSGGVNWYREYGSWGVNNLFVRRAFELSNGTITAVSGVNDTIILFNTNGNGIVQWAKGFHFSNGTGHLWANDFVVANDGGFALVAVDNDKGHFIKTDASGTIFCDTVNVAFTSNAATITPTITSSLVTTISFPDSVPFFIESRGLTISVSCLLSGIADINNADNDVAVYPNPFSTDLTIAIDNNERAEIIVYDIASRKMVQQKFTASVKLKTEHFAKGVYIYEVRNNKGTIKKGKIVKE